VRLAAQTGGNLKVDNMSLANGSVTVQMIINLLEAYGWHSVLGTWLIFKVDPHRLFDQLKETVKEIKTNKNDKNRIDDLANKYNVTVVLEESDFILLNSNGKAKLKIIENAMQTKALKRIK